MSEQGKKLPGRLFFLDEFGSDEVQAEWAAGRPTFFVPRDYDQPKPPPPAEEPTEWPAGWVEIGATTDGADEAARLQGIFGGER